MQHRHSVSYSPLISDEKAVNQFRKALGMFMGRGKRWKLEEVSRGAGIAPDTLGRFRTYEPSDKVNHRSLDFGQMLSVASFIGADFTSEWLKLCDQGAYDFPDDEPNPGDLASEVTENAAAVVRGINGGGAANLPQIGARMMRHGQAISTMGARAA